MALQNGLVNLLFPSRCPYCGEVIRHDESFCHKCSGVISKYVINYSCGSCAQEKRKCGCGRKKQEFIAAAAPFYYEKEIKRAVYSLKFFGNTGVAGEMVERMVRSVWVNFPDVSFDCVTAVPLSSVRRRERGYNQSDVLARAIAGKLGAMYSKKLLKKIVDNKPQHEIEGKLRHGNVSGVYECFKNADISGKTILLIDDVMTTGATANECAKMLNLAGAGAVYCACFAVTPNENRHDEKRS